MSKKTTGAIAALEYHTPPRLDFPDIVEEFDLSSNALSTQVRGLTWDGDDIAIIDREAVRIVLGWLPPASARKPHYLVIAVGPPGRKPRSVLDPDAYDVLLRRAIDRVRGYLPYDARLYGTATQPITSALVDQTFDLLSSTAPDVPAPETGKRDAAQRHDWAEGAVNGGRRFELGKTATVPLRLTIITFGLTLFLHVPPLGAALLTYSTLREAQPLLLG